jgi:hypothetical protein
LLTLQGFVAAAAALVAVVALVRARGLARRLERLSESYWELRYEHGQLTSRVSRLEATGDASSDGAPVAPGREGGTTFVPLSTLKR